MPSLGADMEAGKIVEWLVHEGDTVHRGDIVAVVDTDKADIDVEVFEGGVVERILVPAGERVPVGTPLAEIRDEGEVAAVAPAVEAPAEPAPAPEPEPVPSAASIANGAFGSRTVCVSVTAGVTPRAVSPPQIGGSTASGVPSRSRCRVSAAVKPWRPSAPGKAP